MVLQRGADQDLMNTEVNLCNGPLHLMLIVFTAATGSCSMHQTLCQILQGLVQNAVQNKCMKCSVSSLQCLVPDLTWQAHAACLMI